MATSITHWPIAVFEDRYEGCYSRGRWLAVSKADELIGGEKRASWVLGNGPFGGDTEAMRFWDGAPNWIAAGDTPEQAVKHLLDQN
ncbi:hypothetical protein BH09PSE1_BH09PSE1_06860 [soil metagenome]